MYMQCCIPRILQLFHIQSCYGFCEGTIAKVWRCPHVGMPPWQLDITLLVNTLKSLFSFVVMSIFKWLIKTKGLE